MGSETAPTWRNGSPPHRRDDPLVAGDRTRRGPVPGRDPTPRRPTPPTSRCRRRAGSRQRDRRRRGWACPAPLRCRALGRCSRRAPGGPAGRLGDVEADGSRSVSMRPRPPPPGGCQACSAGERRPATSAEAGSAAVTGGHRVRQRREVALRGLELRHERRARRSAPALSCAPRPRGYASPRRARARPIRSSGAPSSRSASAPYSSATMTCIVASSSSTPAFIGASYSPVSYVPSTSPLTRRPTRRDTRRTGRARRGIPPAPRRSGTASGTTLWWIRTSVRSRTERHELRGDPHARVRLGPHEQLGWPHLVVHRAGSGTRCRRRR